MRGFTIVFFLLIVVLAWNASVVTAQFLEAGVQKLETPVNAPDFTLKQLGGQKISLEELKGKVVLLNFFSPSCSVCQKQSSSFDKLNKVVKNKDAVFLNVAVEGREKDLQKYKSEFNISAPILIDKDGAVAKAYGIRGHHETFFINRKGKIVGKTFAEKDWTTPAVRNLIQYLLREDR